MREIDYYELGATLYLSVLHDNLPLILKREKYPRLRSLVICLEDALAQKDFPEGMIRLQQLIFAFEPTSLKVFIRPRDISNFIKILQMTGIEKVDGFALAKFDTDSMTPYLTTCIEHHNFYFMPILETKDVFSSQKLNKILIELEPFKDRVLTVRIGIEDILSHLTMLRLCHQTIYDIMPIYIILSTIYNLFKSNGYALSSPVFGCFENLVVFQRELIEDTNHQIFNKTIVHPNQIDVAHQSYRIDQDSYNVAKRLLESDEAIFGHRGRMYEKSTHTPWAQTVIKRQKYYGMIQKETDAE